MEPSSGSRLGHYEMRDRPGKGGIGEACRAHDIRLDREVALKILLVELAPYKDRRMRFDARPGPSPRWAAADQEEST